MFKTYAEEKAASKNHVSGVPAAGVPSNPKVVSFGSVQVTRLYAWEILKLIARDIL